MLILLLLKTISITMILFVGIKTTKGKHGDYY
ncbi:hypothetical protein IE044AEMC_01509 [Enterococcus faecalis]|nr:hypothetical protein IE313HC_01278 [Enterococcus faecalis]CAC9764727.1 hypothetical protein IE044AEGC_01343 [Enterococcus faecalis]CAC9770263.1 hypothetical protein IE183ART_02505 [Enterococcus faecalis]CAC9778626.1 hypothetical protein IE044AEMC_01509 [Enterococcus faecalis]CAC9780095.1 hypothetical protein IE044CO2MC_01271 [Enterococcus faecalis]